MKKHVWKRRMAAGLLAAVMAGTVLVHVPEERVKADYIAADIFHANTANTNMVFQLVEDGPNGDYYYQTVGKHHSSSTVHQTIGLEFSRIRDEFVDANGWNPQDWKYPTSQNGNPDVDPHAYVTRADGSTGRVSVVMGRYDDGAVTSYTQLLDNGLELNTWRIDHDALWERIRQTQPEWYNELQAKIAVGEEYYFGVDAVKTIITGYDDSLSDDLDECQFLNYRQNANGWLVMVDGLPSYDGQDTLYTWSNWDRDTWEKSMKPYFNKYYRGGHNITDKPEVEEPVISPGETMTLTKNEDPGGESNIGKGTGTNASQDAYSAPRVYTYNESSDFNVGVGIPTTESYENHIDVSSWYGSVDITKRDYSREIKLVYQVQYTVREEDWMILRADATRPDGYIVTRTFKAGDTDMVYGYVVRKHTYITPGEEISSTWAGSYYAITGMNLYELYPGTTTTNNSASPSTVSYTDAAHVPYTATINGTTISSGSSTATDERYTGTLAITDAAHVDIHTDRMDMSTIFINIGESAENNTEALIEGRKRAQAEADRRIKNNADMITLINDELTINGAVYLDQDGLWNGTKGSALEFKAGSTYEMTDASKVQKDTITNQKTRTIPESKANGYYSIKHWQDTAFAIYCLI